MKLVSLTHLPEEQVSHNPAITKKVMLRSQDLPNLTNFSQAYFAPGQIASAHAHEDMCEVFFVESGQGIIRINGTSHSIKPGTCIAVEPSEVHEAVNDGQEPLVLTYFGLRVNATPSLIEP